MDKTVRENSILIDNDYNSAVKSFEDKHMSREKENKKKQKEFIRKEILANIEHKLKQQKLDNDTER